MNCSRIHIILKMFETVFKLILRGPLNNSEMSRIFLDFSDSSLQPLILLLLMHFDFHKKSQLHQITLSLPSDHFITFNDNNILHLIF